MTSSISVRIPCKLHKLQARVIPSTGDAGSSSKSVSVSELKSSVDVLKLLQRKHLFSLTRLETKQRFDSLGLSMWTQLKCHGTTEESFVSYYLTR